jgi:hypothetical protein
MVVGIGSMLALAYFADSMTPLRLEVILFLIGIGFGPTAPLTQVMLQNTVSLHNLGSAIGTMNFVRTLMSTVLVAIFGAIVLANASVPGSIDTAHVVDTIHAHALAGTSIVNFSHVFLGVVGTMTIAFIAMLVIEEKPLSATMPEPQP